MINFEQELNQEQLDVVQNGDGPCLVLAGAGSGKTRTITYRVAYLLEKGVNPENILLVTFTNKAANEMIERVQKITGLESRLPWSGTFHHIGNKILRKYAAHLGYKNNFTVLDADDAQALLKLVVKEFKTGEKFPSAKIIGNIISYARNADSAVGEVIDKKYPGYWPLADTFADIASRYALKKKEASAMDFDDLLVNLSALFNLPAVQHYFATQFQYILVDEYQDTNKIQAAIIDKLATIHKNILVVGDDAQSIYSFRAADIRNILNFEEKYPDAKIFRLETNYRSSEEILDLANNIISNNSKQYAKKLRALKSGLPKPALHPQINQESEANFIVKKITEALDMGIKPDQNAILFRATHHSQALEIALARAGILYDYRGGLRFFERAHVKDILSYLRIFNNLADIAAWMRILQHEEGIGPAAAQKIIAQVQRLENIDQLKNIGDNLSGKALAGWNNFFKIFGKLLERSAEPDSNTGELISALLESNYIDYLETEFLDSDDRKKDLQQLAELSRKQKDLSDFLAEASLQESFTHPHDQHKLKEGRVVLSTIHQAKGLEWKNVFIINLVNEGFPNARALREENGLEEERRLFYVAVTRAKENLYLTFPMQADSWGGGSGPSIFLSEISQDLLDDHSLLRSSSSVFNNSDDDEIQYISEDDEQPIKIKPGSFLRSVDDL